MVILTFNWTQHLVKFISVYFVLSRSFLFITAFSAGYIQFIFCFDRYNQGKRQPGFLIVVRPVNFFLYGKQLLYTSEINLSNVIYARCTSLISIKLLQSMLRISLENFSIFFFLMSRVSFSDTDWVNFTVLMLPAIEMWQNDQLYWYIVCLGYAQMICQYCWKEYDQ